MVRWFHSISLEVLRSWKFGKSLVWRYIVNTVHVHSTSYKQCINRMRDARTDIQPVTTHRFSQLVPRFNASWSILSAALPQGIMRASLGELPALVHKLHLLKCTTQVNSCQTALWCCWSFYLMTGQISATMTRLEMCGGSEGSDVRVTAIYHHRSTSGELVDQCQISIAP